MNTTAPPTIFRYEAQTRDGHTLRGSLRAKGHDDAVGALEQAELRVVEIAQAPNEPGRALRGTDFFAFNQQLAQLTDAGLPVESGLRMIADDMKRGRLSASVRAVADELDRGASLPEAFERHRKRFPPLYSRLVEAGIRSNRLSSVLLNLSRHLEVMQRIKATLWRAGAYPLVVLITLALILGFIGIVILPGFEEIYEDFGTQLPPLTLTLLWLSDYAFPLLVGFFALLVAVPLATLAARALGLGGSLRDRLFLPIPLIGPALQRNLMVRWCDLLRVGVGAGMDLPEALMLAGQGVASSPVMRDSAQLIETLEAGKPMNQVGRLRVVPPSVPTAIHLASEHADLAAMLGDLSAMYEQQAELRLNSMQVTLAPLMLICLGGLIGTVVVAIFLPLVKLMTSIM